MYVSWIVWGSLIMAIATGLVGGVLLSFSDFVMGGLRASAPVAGIEAMQMINRTVYRSVFMVLFMGMALVSAVVFVYAIVYGLGAATWPVALGALVYLIGVFAVTGLFNVPMNTQLDVLDPASLAAAQYWPEYYQRWVAWNHVRSIASIVAMACFMIGAVQFGNA